MDLIEYYNNKNKPFYDIIGAAYESANWFKHGMHEDVYETGLKKGVYTEKYEYCPKNNKCERL